MARAWVGTVIGLIVIATAIFAAAPTADAQTPALYFQGGSIPASGVGSVDVVLDNPVGNLSAYILAIAHDPNALTLQNVDISNTPVVDSDPEFISSEIQTSGGILTVIFDFEIPLDGHSMPPGMGLVIARYFYSSVSAPIDPDPATTHTINFVDGVLGFPPINNVLNIEGAQVPANMTPGTVTCEPYVAPNGKLYCGEWNPLSQQVEGVAQRVGSTLTLSFFYDEPNDFIQGLEFAIEHDSRLTVESVCLDTTGSALESAGAEFINCIVDNEPADDGCHFAVGALLDALPPFDGQLLSPTNVPTLLGSIEMRIDAATTPGEQLSAVFTPWTTIDLMFVVDGQIQPVDETYGAVVNALPPISILRGDCNNDGSVDLADAIQVINVVFFSGDMLGCEEACNHNGDAAFDVADYVYLVNYFFLEGPQPPAPFPNCGGMPGIDCEVQTNCP